jgi:hypothetical protein
MHVTQGVSIEASAVDLLDERSESLLESPPLRVL